MEMENTSGQGASAVVPDEIKGWNWGAFSLTWIWALGNKVWTGALAVIPVMLFLTAAYLSIRMEFPQETFVFYFACAILLGTAVVFGVKGNKWAWHRRDWASVRRFRKVQRVWGLVGVVYTLAWIYGIWCVQQIALAIMMAFPTGSG